MRLDNTHYDGWERVRKRWERNEGVGRDGEDVVQRMENLPSEDHVVFVTNKMHKKFGQFVGANGKGQVVVRFEQGESYTFKEKEVISM